MPTPAPRKDEDKDVFVGRCMRFLADEDSSLSQEQRVAACHTKFRERKKKKEGLGGFMTEKFNFLIPITERVDQDGDFLIRGIAINETTTRNGHTFVGEELEKSAHTLRNKPVLKDHVNSVDAVVGRTTDNVRFDHAAKNIPFEAVIKDKSMVQKIRDDLIQSVSVGATVRKFEEVLDEETGEVSNVILKGIDFVELSLVAVPADPNAGLMARVCSAWERGKDKVDKVIEVLEANNMVEKEKEEVKELTSEKEALASEIETLQVQKLKIEKERLEAEVKAAEEEEPEPEAKAEDAPEEEGEEEEKEESEASEEKVKVEDKTVGKVKKVENKEVGVDYLSYAASDVHGLAFSVDYSKLSNDRDCRRLN